MNESSEVLTDVKEDNAQVEAKAAAAVSDDTGDETEATTEKVDKNEFNKLLKTVTKLRAERREMAEKLNEISGFVDEYKALKKVETLRATTAEKMTADGLEFIDQAHAEKYFSIAAKLGEEEAQFVLAGATKKAASQTQREIKTFVEVEPKKSADMEALPKSPADYAKKLING